MIVQYIKKKNKDKPGPNLFPPTPLSELNLPLPHKTTYRSDEHPLSSPFPTTPIDQKNIPAHTFDIKLSPIITHPKYL